MEFEEVANKINAIMEKECEARDVCRGCEYVVMCEGADWWKRPQEIIKFVEEYERKHRKKTFKDVIKERLPHACEDTDDIEGELCVRRLFGEDVVDCGRVTCTECWNYVAPNEYQEKE